MLHIVLGKCLGVLIECCSIQTVMVVTLYSIKQVVFFQCKMHFYFILIVTSNYEHLWFDNFVLLNVYFIQIIVL